MSQISNHHQTLTEVLLSHQNIDNLGITFIEGNTKRVFMSYQNLYQKVLQLLNTLQSNHLMPGNEVVLQIPKEEQFIIAFWACILGGFIPIPLAVKHNEDNYNKLFNIWQQLKHAYWLTPIETEAELIKFTSETNHPLYHIIKNKIILIDPQHSNSSYGNIYRTNPNDLAFIQYSSGSTGNPKGIMLTHHNLLTNIIAIHERIQLTNLDRILSWQPLTHDMGLIGMHLSPLTYGCNHYFLPTSQFIRKPLSWITIASDYKINILSSPNFGINLFLNAFDDTADYPWDLSQVRLVVNGAEPSNNKLCVAFINSLKKYHLKPTTMYPVYGLAEATVGVTFPKLKDHCLSYVQVHRDKLSIGDVVEFVNNKSSNFVTFLEVGSPLQNCQIKIQDLNNQELPENKIGRIYIRGENVTQGYYNDPIQTAQTINAEGWLNTGDLGFIHQGKLVITGREKTLIKINGQSYYPFDIERTAEELPEIKPGKIAVCGIYDPMNQTESICIFLVFRSKLEKFIPILLNIKHHLQNKMGLLIQDFIPIHSIPMTTSGKIKYYLLTQNYLNHSYDPIIHQINELLNLFNAPAEKRNDSLPAIENNLLDIARKVLKIQNINSTFNISEYGIDSTKIIQFQDQIASIYPNLFSITDFYRTTSIYGIASLIYNRLHQKAPNNFTYAITINLNSVQKLLLLAHFFQTDLNMLFLGAYFYLVKESFNIHLIKISIQKSDRFIPLELDFNLINYFHEILLYLQKIDSSVTVPSVNQGQQKETTFLYIGYQEEFNELASQDYGLILHIEQIQDRFITCFKCHRKVLYQENVKYLAEGYYNLLESLIDQYELHYQTNIV